MIPPPPATPSMKEARNTPTTTMSTIRNDNSIGNRNVCMVFLLYLSLKQQIPVHVTGNAGHLSGKAVLPQGNGIVEVRP